MKTRLVPFSIKKAKNGAKVVTRDGLPVKIVDYPIKNEDCPILGLVLIEGKEFPLIFTNTGSHYNNSESCYDLFIEEEVEEDDSDYDPYKATVESISDMVERYSELQSLEELKDFYNNVRIKCRDAFEYGKVCMINLDEKPADNKPKSQKGDWSIQDAKPGDILASTNGLDILIFKEIDNSLYFSSFYNIRGRGEYYWTSSNFIPATKEQRELLFKKMKEAGYEWDSDKKELRKIDAFPTEKDTKIRSMTNQELADWLRKCPEEFREFTFKDGTGWVYSYLDYLESEADEPAKKNKLIRRNHGEWEEPLIEE